MAEETVFAAALEKGTPAERAAFLDEACAGDPALRARVEALLRSHAEAGGFLGTPAVQRAVEELRGPAGSAATAGEPPGGGETALDFLAPAGRPDSLGRLGHYEVLGLVGRGGMGVVLKAFDEKLQRVVAVKVMAAPLATSATARRRFTREAQAAAAVRNEHVIDIHAVEEANGLPYLVMEYVSGRSLQERLDQEGPLGVAEVLRIAMQIAAGLAAAHAQGLVHRDVKPANILLENGVERVKITDFGLARAGDDASLTQSGAVAGTPMYMAPEQARGEAVDHRADLFSLGSVLYAMCTGQPPFRASGTLAVLKCVAEEEPRPVREVNAEVPDWLAAIIGRLHAKDPAERFPSAGGVAELLGQHLAHLQQPARVPRPVPPAPRAGAGPRGRSRRRRLWAAAAAVLLLVGLGATEATGVTRLTATVIRVLTPDGTLVVEVDDPAVRVTVEGDGGLVITGAGPQEVRLRPGSYRLLASKGGQPVKSEIVTIARGDRQVVKVSLEPTGPSRALAPFQFVPPPPGPLDRVDPARIPAEERFDWQPNELVAVLGEHRQRHWVPVGGVAYSSDGKLIASSDDAEGVNVIRVWDAETMRERQLFRGHTRPVRGVAFSPDCRRLLSGSWDGTMRLWDVATGTELRRFPLPTGTDSVCFSPDGRYALSGSHRNDAHLWDVETGQKVRRFEGHTGVVTSVAFSPDGRQALTGSGDYTVRLWDVQSGKELYCMEGHRGRVQAVAFSPDGRLALSGNTVQGKEKIDSPAPDYDLRLWDLKTGKERRRFAGHTREIFRVAFSPDGRHALSSSCDGTLRLWEVENGKELRRFEGHVGRALALACSPDGCRAVSGGEDGTVRLWDIETGKELRPITGPIDRAHQVAFSPSGDQILSAGGDRIVRLWDVATGKEIRRFVGHTDPVVGLSLSEDGRRVLSGSCEIDWWLPQPADGDRTGPWRLWDVATGKQIGRFYGPTTDYLGCVALSPDGKRALTGCGKRLLLWDVESGRELRALDGHTNVVTSVAFSPDGVHALSGGMDGHLRLWEIRSGKELRCLKGHTVGVRGVAISPDGRYAVSGGCDQTVRLWDLTGDESAARVFFKWHTSEVLSVAFAPDGRMMASGGDDGRIILWDVAADDKLREWQLPGPVHGVTFARDGRHLATANGNGTVYVLRLAAKDGKELPVGKDVMPSAPGDRPVGKVSPEPGAQATATGQVGAGPVRTFAGHTGPVSSVAFTPSGDQILSASDDSSVRVWDVASGKEKQRFEGHQGTVRGLAVDPNGVWAISAASARRQAADGGAWRVCMWEIASGKELRQLSGSGPAMMSVALSRDGRRALFANYEGTVWLYDVENWRELRRFSTYPGHCHVAFAPNGKQMLTGAFEGEHGSHMSLWNLDTGEEVKSFDGTNGIGRTIFTPDGKQIVSAGFGDSIVRIWDAAKGTELGRLRGHISSVAAVAISADGRWAVSGAYDMTVRVWDLEKRTERHVFETGHTSGVQSVDISRDGRFAVSGSFDGTLRLWRLPP
jgi:WD40 repeat protein